MGGGAGRIIKLEAGRVIQIPHRMNANITGLRVTWQHTFCKPNGPWCWERLKAGGEGDDRGWDGWMASPTQWTWVWVNSGSWWWTGRPGVLQSMGSQRVGHDWVTELNWTERALMEYEMATHSSIIAWRIPWTEDSGGLQSTGLQRLRSDSDNDKHTCMHAIPWGASLCPP